MLTSLKQIQGSKVRIEGLAFGKLKDVYFDDLSWQVSWLIVRFGRGKTAFEVAIEPSTVRKLSARDSQIDLALTEPELRASPLACQVQPVSKQYENLARSPGRLPKADPHLRSFDSVLGYSLYCAPSDAGTLDDLLVDTKNWSIRYLLGRSQLAKTSLLFHLLPSAVDRFSWATNRVYLREFAPVRLEEASEVDEAGLGNLAAA